MRSWSQFNLTIQFSRSWVWSATRVVGWLMMYRFLTTSHWPMWWKSWGIWKLHLKAFVTLKPKWSNLRRRCLTWSRRWQVGNNLSPLLELVDPIRAFSAPPWLLYLQFYEIVSPLLELVDPKRASSASPLLLYLSSYEIASPFFTCAKPLSLSHLCCVIKPTSNAIHSSLT